MDGILGHFNFFIVLMKIFKFFSNAYKTFLLFKNIFLIKKQIYLYKYFFPCFPRRKINTCLCGSTLDNWRIFSLGLLNGRLVNK